MGDAGLPDRDALPRAAAARGRLGSEQHFERILEPEPPGLDARERLVRDYARLVTERAWGIPEAVFEGLRRCFSDREIVELTVRIGICSLFNKLNQALQVDIEETALADMLARGVRP